MGQGTRHQDWILSRWWILVGGQSLACVPHFQHPNQLAWLGCLPLMWWWQRRVLRQQTHRQSLFWRNTLHQEGPGQDLAKDQGPTSSHPAAKLTWIALWGWLGYVLLIVALADPSWTWQLDTTLRSSGDVVIVLDVSESMLVQDVQPTSIRRLQQAKQKILDCIANLPQHRIALIAMAGSSVTLSPLTFDHQAIEQLLALIEPEHMPIKGTDIGGALKTAEQLLQAAVPDYRHIVLISDGEDHTESWRDVVHRLQQEHIPIYPWIFGSEAGGHLPASANHPKRQQIVSQRNSKHLCQMVTDPTHTCVLASLQGEDVRQILSWIQQQAHLEQRFEGRRRIWQGHYLWFAALALLLLYAHWLGPILFSWPRSFKAIKGPWTTLLLMGAIGWLLATCQPDRGDEAQQEGAVIPYLPMSLGQAEQRQASQPNVLSHGFTLGHVYYLNRQFLAAEQMYALAGHHGRGLQAGFAWFNLGHSLVQQGKWQAALQAYRRAMEDPQLTDLLQPVSQALKQRMAQTSSHGFLKSPQAALANDNPEARVQGTWLMQANEPQSPSKPPPEPQDVEPGRKERPFDLSQAKQWLDNLRESPLRPKTTRQGPPTASYSNKDW